MVEKKDQKVKANPATGSVTTYKHDGKLMDRFINLVHLSRKAGKLGLGFDNLERALAHHKCKIIIIAEDLARNSYEKLERLIAERSVKVVRVGTKKRYGDEFGALEIGVLFITDTNFAAGIMKILANQ
ncbi:MAG TPA: ribosomal L7Ae/L30e/S12e/Gadd45 family protein [Candidatus Cloacimonadota bacterium]|nr:ribosomal L7Ae/L30e/S12e/Gadd45 family protein [Candidatus Cloacimonadota bacterium]